MTDDIHIRLDQPKVIRRELLESALNSSEFLQVMQRIQTFEQERLQLKDEFRRAMTDLTTATNQFLKSIPPLPMEFIQKQQQMLQRQMMQQPLKVLTPRQELASRFQQQQTAAPAFKNPLEEEIDELRRKIQNLSL